jgi:hypothetical protein
MFVSIGGQKFFAVFALSAAKLYLADRPSHFKIRIFLTPNTAIAPRNSESRPPFTHLLCILLILSKNPLLSFRPPRPPR